MRNLNQGTARVALLLCVVVLCLIVLRYIPPFSVGGYEVKSVDMLSDVVGNEDTDSLPASGAVLAKTRDTVRVKEVMRDTFPPGMTGIEDYGYIESDSTRGMKYFYEAVAERRNLGRPVRIAYFGDSFIEGDIITADLRAMLQRHFGGCGVGFVDIASPFTKLRTSVTHKAAGWTDHNVLEKKSCDRTHLGITGRYAIGSSGASVSYGGVKSYANLDTFSVATLYLASSAPTGVTVSVNGAEAEEQTVGGGNNVQSVTREGRIGSVRFNLTGGTATAYGVALEGRSGIILDNFSMRGSSGTPLASIPASHLSQLYSLRPYDLVVLQFGLNVAAKGQLKYTSYIKSMKKVIRHFKQCFPHASIIVVSVGDREMRENGTLQTMSAIKALAKCQQTMAAEEGVAFWNLFEGMGGEGSMRRMVEAKPSEAALDYTHINRRGGKKIADKFYKAIVFGYEQYLKRRNL